MSVARVRGGLQDGDHRRDWAAAELAGKLYARQEPALELSCSGSLQVVSVR